MKIIQAYKKKNENWQYLTNKEDLKNPLVLVFANRMQLELSEVIDAIRKEFPYEHLVFGSTAGEILDANVFDDSIVVTVIEFEKSTFKIRTDNIFNHKKDANALGKLQILAKVSIPFL
ncbi:FIST N-terminal domain-containing protein [Flavobacterium araucananum]|uniref:FIST domain-containing protein n=1 Tax=Flavobacterium araucananum TaxID=946678 RepID=A0A227PDH7_9FLAO|nr:FIST N-terminal domain-containing protein [Flavobacterium araucananum]OXG07852.1 hypothetical protein B0A64_07645 [Flavobacterium araucananum]